MQSIFWKLASLALCGSAMQLNASPPVLGIARSWGVFFVNDSSVPGSATILDGSSLRTADASSQLTLVGGERVTLSANSAAVFRSGRLLLSHGVVEFGGSAPYRIEVRNLSIGSPDASARMRVGIDPQNRVLAASLSGPGEVRNSSGRLIARILSGAALTLAAASPEAVDLTGVVETQNGKFYLTDEVTHLKVELRANGLAQATGKRIRLKGELLAAEAVSPDAPPIVMVESATPLPVSAGGGPAAGAGAAGATASTKTIAIIGGVVAAGGTMGGLAATGVIGSPPSISR